MKRTALFFALVVAAPAIATAQQSDSSALQGSASVEMRPVYAELQRKLDSKSARVGDPVEAKTTEKMTTAQGVELPKDTHLIGRVTEVQAHTKENPASSLAIVFDRAEFKGGKTLAIRCIVEAADPPAYPPMTGDQSNTNPFAPSPPPLPPGTSPLAAPLADGRQPGAFGRGIGSNVDAAPAARQPLGRDSAGTAVIDARGRAAASLATHPTGYLGVMLTGSASGTLSGTFTAPTKNIHLDSGAQLVLGVAIRSDEPE